MKTVIFLFLCLLTVPLFAQSSYPPTFKNARVETYREIDSTELKLWIFGESDPKTPKPAIVFFFGGGWNSGSPEQFESQARHFAKLGMIAITADYRLKSRQGVQVVECVKDAKAAIAWGGGRRSLFRRHRSAPKRLHRVRRMPDGLPTQREKHAAEKYLFLAELGGAMVYPLTTVTTIRPLDDGRYAIDTVPSDGLFLGGLGKRKRRTFIASEVVLAAGTMGTQKLLHRMRDEGHLPDLSSRWGLLTRTNCPLSRAVPRLMTGKLYNAGQTCVAPDYLLTREGQEAALEDRVRWDVAKLYPRLVDNPDYTQNVSRDHNLRLQSCADDARAKGGRVVVLASDQERGTLENKVFPPTLIFSANPDLFRH